MVYNPMVYNPMVNISNGEYIQWCALKVLLLVHISNGEQSNGGNIQLSQTLELRIQVF